MMKKIIAILLCISCLFFLGGCHSFFADEEQEIYNKTVNELLAALDDKNADTIYNLFSPSVQNECTDLKEKIEELISIYNAPTEKIGNISSLAGEASYENGKTCKNAYTTFPVFSAGKYYWFYLELMYENTFDESQIGITQLDFYTADAYYEFRSSEGKQEQNKGLNIFNENVDAYNIISINNYPYDYHPTEILHIKEVETFFETSTSVNAFVKRFGDAAAKDEFGFIYSLPTQDGEERYLCICCDGDEIIYSEILSNYSYIDTVFQ